MEEVNGEHVPTSFCGCWGRVGQTWPLFPLGRVIGGPAGCRAHGRAGAGNGADLEPHPSF